jgi:hypothetical protein
MPLYSTYNRFSLIQLHSEDRKQRAHLKKITEMQRRSGLDNAAPLRVPNLNQRFLKQFNERNQVINKENEVQSKKLVNIMTSKITHPTPPFHPTYPIHRSQTLHLSHNNADYLARIAKAKGKYDAREWRKQYEQHKEHLKISKDNKMFTPLDIGVNRQRMIRTTSLMNSKQTTPLSSTMNMSYKYDKTD